MRGEEREHVGQQLVLAALSKARLARVSQHVCVKARACGWQTCLGPWDLLVWGSSPVWHTARRSRSRRSFSLRILPKWKPAGLKGVQTCSCTAAFLGLVLRRESSRLRSGPRGAWVGLGLGLGLGVRGQS